jgi:hypothetical protein
VFFAYRIRKRINVSCWPKEVVRRNHNPGVPACRAGCYGILCCFSLGQAAGAIVFVAFASVTQMAIKNGAASVTSARRSLSKSYAVFSINLSNYGHGNAEEESAIQAYLASIAFADTMLGRVLDGFNQSPQKDNTILVLWSDHGWHLREKRHWEKWPLWRKARAVCL